MIIFIVIAILLVLFVIGKFVDEWNRMDANAYLAAKHRAERRAAKAARDAPRPTKRYPPS